MSAVKRIEQSQELELAFWSHVERRGPDDCWLWTGRRDTWGYGALSFRGKSYVASRLSWAIANHAQPDGYVCHSCDNPPCVNPAHLWLGDAAANNADKVAKGRHHNQRKTHCRKGHPYSGDNAYVFRGWRYCKECNREAVAAYKLRRKATNDQQR